MKIQDEKIAKANKYKSLEEYQNYLNAKENLKNVSRGDKDYHSCSFMDISVREDRFKSAEDKLITALGKIILGEIENDK